MALGKVQINNLNLNQGDPKEIERHFLFVGAAGKTEEASKLFSVNAQTDLTTEFVESNLRSQVIAAQLNAGQNWTAAVYPLGDGETIESAIDKANEIQSFEMVVICDVQTTAAQLQAIHDKCFSLQAKLGRWVSALVATPGIDKATQTWQAYESAQIAVVNGLACKYVTPVPQLHGNDVGVLAGRLCNHSVSIADSPMRTATGSVMGLGAKPTDSNDKPLELSTLNTLSEARFSVCQWYPDFEGVYWGDATTLDAVGGDYQYLENVRVVHKASREIRVLAIGRVADRVLNSTPTSISMNKSYFMTPLRRMSKSFTINDVQFPGDVMPPEEDDIDIVWKTKNQVVIPVVVRPHNIPKGIEINIALDLKNK